MFTAVATSSSSPAVESDVSDDEPLAAKIRKT